MFDKLLLLQNVVEKKTILKILNSLLTIAHVCAGIMIIIYSIKML